MSIIKQWSGAPLIACLAGSGFVSRFFIVHAGICFGQQAFNRGVAIKRDLRQFVTSIFASLDRHYSAIG
ncbi:MAG: hypothetical protein GY949_02050 [Gammaproteobacteria bacterium]|nr:hypothetical protein [Gammaproteobacteria bacterium]